MKKKIKKNIDRAKKKVINMNINSKTPNWVNLLFIDSFPLRMFEIINVFSLLPFLRFIINRVQDVVLQLITIFELIINRGQDVVLQLSAVKPRYKNLLFIANNLFDEHNEEVFGLDIPKKAHIVQSHQFDGGGQSKNVNDLLLLLQTHDWVKIK
jgi:hypothetical protein